MTGYETDPAQLHRSADRLADLHAEFESGGRGLRFTVRPDRAGEVLLAQSLSRFHQASLQATELAAADLARLAGRLHTAADHYEGYESDAAETIRAAGVASPEVSTRAEDPNGIRKVLG